MYFHFLFSYYITRGASSSLCSSQFSFSSEVMSDMCFGFVFSECLFRMSFQNAWHMIIYIYGQSQIEIEYYSVVYFQHITEFVALLCSASAKGGAHMWCVNHEYLMHLWTTYEPCPRRTLSAIARQTQWCAQNTQWNNIEFLSGTATYPICKHSRWGVWSWVIFVPFVLWSLILFSTL